MLWVGAWWLIQTHDFFLFHVMLTGRLLMWVWKNLLGSLGKHVNPKYETLRMWASKDPRVLSPSLSSAGLKGSQTEPPCSSFAKRQFEMSGKTKLLEEMQGKLQCEFSCGHRDRPLFTSCVSTALWSSQCSWPDIGSMGIYLWYRSYR